MIHDWSENALFKMVSIPRAAIAQKNPGQAAPAKAAGTVGVLTFAIIICLAPSVLMGNACLNMNNKHSKFLLLDAILHHNWCIDKRALRYPMAFAHASQIRIADR
jgi:hypothetical protein